MVARYWRCKTHPIQIFNTIYKGLFIVDISFIDGNQYNANIIGRDPINDTAILRIAECTHYQNNLKGPILKGRPAREQCNK
jgi:hypothetical protein